MGNYQIGNCHLKTPRGARAQKSPPARRREGYWLFGSDGGSARPVSYGENAPDEAPAGPLHDKPGMSRKAYADQHKHKVEDETRHS